MADGYPDRARGFAATGLFPGRRPALFPELRPGLCLTLFLLSAGCADEPDPARQDPVDPAPGEYALAVAMSGWFSDVEGAPDTYCLRAENRADLPHLLAENFFMPHGACANERAPRQGNAVGGEIRCLADAKLANGVSRFVYDGAVSAEGAAVEVRIRFDAAVKEARLSREEAMQLKLGMTLLERARYRIEASRIGDC